MGKLLKIIAPTALAYAWRNRKSIRGWLDRRNDKAGPTGPTDRAPRADTTPSAAEQARSQPAHS